MVTTRQTSPGSTAKVFASPHKAKAGHSLRGSTDWSCQHLTHLSLPAFPSAGASQGLSPLLWKHNLHKRSSLQCTGEWLSQPIPRYGLTQHLSCPCHQAHVCFVGVFWLCCHSPHPCQCSHSMTADNLEALIEGFIAVLITVKPFLISLWFTVCCSLLLQPLCILQAPAASPPWPLILTILPGP